MAGAERGANESMAEMAWGEDSGARCAVAVRSDPGGMRNSPAN